MATFDNESLQAAVAGDREALVRLLELAGPEVRGAISTRLPHQWQSLLSVDDVLQQTYTDAFLSIGGFRPASEQSFQAWLITLAKRNLADAIRMLTADKRGGPRRRRAAGREESLDVLLAQLAAGENTPSRQASAAEQRRALNDAVGQLPEPHRTVVRLHDLEGESIRRIAEMLQRSAGAVYMLRARAHRWLADRLGHPSDFFSDFA